VKAEGSQTGGDKDIQNYSREFIEPEICEDFRRLNFNFSLKHCEIVSRQASL
jgi:hypothetical protein